MIYILSLTIGFIIGCIGMHSAISKELQQCKTYEELVRILINLYLLKTKNNKKC